MNTFTILSYSTATTTKKLFWSVLCWQSCGLLIGLFEHVRCVWPFFLPRVNERPERTQIVDLVSCTAAPLMLQHEGHVISLDLQLLVAGLTTDSPHLRFSHQVQNALTSSERSWRRSRGRNLSRKQPTRNFSPLSANRATIRVKRRAVMRTKKRSCLKEVVCLLFLHRGQHR